MSFRIAHFNILGKNMAGSMWFHYARDFVPKGLSQVPDWWRSAGYPRSLLWKEGDGPSRFHRFPVLLAEIRALRADIICLVELDCFPEFRDVLHEEGYDAVFKQRPGKGDGCGIFWRREVFAPGADPSSIIYEMPANDRMALAQPLWHLETQKPLVVISTHLHYDQEAGHQLHEARELLAFQKAAEDSAGPEYAGCASVICGDLNSQPGSPAYELLCGSLADAATAYTPGSFTSIKPDVYYYAKPRGSQWDPNAAEEWHLQTGRQEVIDYLLYRPGTLEVTAPPELPEIDPGQPSAKKSKKKPPFGYWSGGWAFASSPAAGFEEHKHDWTWLPERVEGELQLGIPNRLHGSDHIPIASTFKFSQGGGGAASTPSRKRARG